MRHSQFTMQINFVGWMAVSTNKHYFLSINSARRCSVDCFYQLNCCLCSTLTTHVSDKSAPPTTSGQRRMSTAIFNFCCVFCLLVNDRRPLQLNTISLLFWCLLLACTLMFVHVHLPYSVFAGIDKVCK